MFISPYWLYCLNTSACASAWLNEKSTSSRKVMVKGRAGVQSSSRGGINGEVKVRSRASIKGLIG